MNDKSKSAKLKSIASALRNLEKATKKEGVAYILGSKEIKPIESIPTGSLMFDLALGVGGFPRGRIIELFGAESSGKTLCATKVAVECQRAGGIVAIVDMEHSFDPYFAKKLGLEIDRGDVIISQPDCMEDAFNVVDTMVDAGVDLIILDSIASLVPKSELEGEIGKQTIGLIAREMSKFLRRIGPKVSVNKTTFICINQVRDAIGVMFGDPTTTPGGRALKFYSSVRVQVARVGSSNITVRRGSEDVVVGYSIRASIKKNKVAPPFRKAEFAVYLDGREAKKDPSDELANVILIRGLIPKYGSDGKISPTGRTYKYTLTNRETGEIIEELIAKKKDDVVVELRKCPKIQEYFIDLLKNGIEEENPHEQYQTDGEMSDEDFEEQLEKEISEIENEAEEIESGWEDL